MIATLDQMPATNPADISESLRHLVSVAAGLSGSVRLVDFYDGVFGEYVDALQAGVDWDGRLLAETLRDIGAGPEAHVVDLCCGSGRIGAYLADQGWDVTGVDRVSSLVDRAPRRRPGRRVRWLQAEVGHDDVGRLVGRPAAAVLGSAGWTLTLSRPAKAEGGPADGRPFRLLGFSPPSEPAGSPPGAP